MPTNNQEKKTNKYGCRPSEDVCLEHERPLITFGICEDSPQIKSFLRQEIRQAKIEIFKKIEDIIAEFGDNSKICSECIGEYIDEALNNLKK